MATITVSSTLITETCCSCGMLFAMTADFHQRRRNDHESFYCPAGHRQWYAAKSEAEQLRDQLAREKHSREQAQARADANAREVEHQQRRINGYKGVVARTKRRIAKGRCVCCSRQFKDLEKHMREEHPGWDPDAAAAAIGGK